MKPPEPDAPPDLTSAAAWGSAAAPAAGNEAAATAEGLLQHIFEMQRPLGGGLRWR